MTSNYVRTLFLLVLVSSLTPLMHVKANNGRTKPPRPVKIFANDFPSSFLINNFSNIYSNNGSGSFNPMTAGVGAEYPKGSNLFVCFQDGLVWGGIHKGVKKVGGSTYVSGLQAGRIVIPGTGSNPPVAADPGSSKIKIYRVRPDINPSVPLEKVSVQLSAEAEIMSRIGWTTIQALYDAYIDDWNKWPAAEGAPFRDNNGNGIYEPAIDVPGIPGADQTLWHVSNDLDPVRTADMYGSPPIGIEFQRSIWGYNSLGKLGNVIFIACKLINRSGAPITQMYVSQWADPDLGYYKDDLVGCDTTLNLGFVYNGSDSDDFYGSTPPSAGYLFVKGPIVTGSPSDSALVDLFRMKKGVRSLRMSSFNYHTNGNSTYADPALSDTIGTTQWYNLMQGLVGKTGKPYVNPLTGTPSTMVLSGDPVAQTGWLDGVLAPSEDRRMVLTSGPFTMANGDTQLVVTALVASGGGTRLENVTGMKSVAAAALDFLNGVPELALTTPDPIYPSGATVTLSGSAKSIRPQALTPMWFIAQKPALSNPMLSAVTPWTVSIQTDRIGRYKIGFTASGARDTVFAQFDISANRAPVATFTVKNEITLGDTLTPDASATSDPDNDPVSYVWKFSGGESGSWEFATADTVPGVLVDPASAQPRYVPYRMSVITASLTVSDGMFSSSTEKKIRVLPMKTNNIAVGTIFPGAEYFSPYLFGRVLVRECNSLLWAGSAGSIAPLDFSSPLHAPKKIDAGGSRFTITESTVFVTASGNSGIFITTIDGMGRITNKIQFDPDNTARYSPDTTAWEVAYRKPYVFYSDGLAGLFVCNLTDPRSPVFVNVYGAGEQWKNFEISGNQLFALHGPTRKLRVVDITNPAVIMPVASIQLDRAYTMLRISGRHLYAAMSETLAVYDISDVTAPVRVAEIAVPKYLRSYNAISDFAVANDRLLMTTTEGSYIYDVASPASPKMLAKFITGIPHVTAFANNARFLVSTLDRYGTSSPDRPHGLIELVLGGSTGVSSADAMLPLQYELAQNYPNPFNPSTTIRYGLPVRSTVRLTVYNTLGQIVAELFNGTQEAGIRFVAWNAECASGLYFCRMEAASVDDPSKRFVKTSKMLLVR